MTGLFKRAVGKPAGAAAAPAARGPEGTTTSKVFPRFLNAIARQAAPVLLDLGPVVGSNITFFGDRLSCKIYVEDLIGDVEAHARRGDRAALAPFFATRLTQADESVDGILCWDLFDFLDKASGQALASRLVRLLRRGGALHGFFGASAAELTTYSRFVVEGADRLRMRPFPASQVRRHVLQPRDMSKMFDGLLVAESVLLKTNTRETLFRKP